MSSIVSEMLSHGKFTELIRGVSLEVLVGGGSGLILRSPPSISNLLSKLSQHNFVANCSLEF